MTITTLNPWHDTEDLRMHTRPTFEYKGNCLFSHRDVKVYKAVAGSWDYVFAGVTITQRAGFTRERAPQIIDDILDGRDRVSTGVATHLRRYRFTPLAYGEHNRHSLIEDLSGLYTPNELEGLGLDELKDLAELTR